MTQVYGGGYAAPPAPVDKVVHGTLAAAEQRNGGWMRFLINTGGQYPYKADTKNQTTIAQAMALMGQQISAAVREQQSTSINPNNGKPYTNRFLNEIAPQGAIQAPPPNPQQAGQPMQQQQQQQQYRPQANGGAQPNFQPRIDGYEKDVNIMRQAAWKGAVALAAAGKIEADPQSMVKACEVALAYYIYGPLRFGVQAFSSHENTPGGGSDDPGPGAPPPGLCTTCGGRNWNHLEGCPDDTVPY